MDIKRDKIEVERILEKLNNPNQEVVCPKCGKCLVLREVGSAVIIECETTGCIKGTVRGV